MRNFKRHEDGQKQAKQANQDFAGLVWVAHLFNAFSLWMTEGQVGRRLPE
jgi:hypothetical protein